MKIFQASLAHINLIYYISHLTYRQHFENIWSEQALENFLFQSFSMESLTHSLNDPQQIWLLVENEQSEILGYAKLNLNIHEPNLNIVGAELQKIYFIKHALGKNIAPIMMQYIIDLTKKSHQKFIFLEVLKNNNRAKKFYQNFGFTKELSIDFQTDLYDIGMDLMQLELQSK